MASWIMVVELTICSLLSLDLVCSTARSFVGSGREYGWRRIGFAECGKWVIHFVIWFCFDNCCCSCICECKCTNQSVEDMYQRLRFNPCILKIVLYICGASLLILQR